MGQDYLYDQFYTLPDVLDRVATICIPIFKKYNIETFVDFSCGNNYFAHLLSTQYGLHTISFDIDPPPRPYGKVIKTDFLSKKRVSTTKLGNVACGLNPPYGPNHTYIRKFVEKSIELYNPKLICLIIPLNISKVLEKTLRLVCCKKLPPKAFYTPDNEKSFTYPTTFCIFENATPVTKSKEPEECPLGYEISSSMDPKTADMMIRSSGRNAGRDIIGRVGKQWIFLRYNDQVEKSRSLQFISLFDNTQNLRFDQHWMKVRFGKTFASETVMLRFFRQLRSAINDPERDLKSPPAIRKHYIIKAINSLLAG